MVALALRPLVLQGCGSGGLLAWPGLAQGHCQDPLQPLTGVWGSARSAAAGGREGEGEMSGSSGKKRDYKGSGSCC